MRSDAVRRTRRSALTLALAAALPLLTAARAQAWTPGYQLERYEPTPAGESFFSVERPWYSSLRWFAGGLTLDYAHDELVFGRTDASGFHQTLPVVQHALLLHVDVAASFLDRVLIETSLPITLHEWGVAADGMAPISGAVVGDPRVGAFVRLFGHAERDPFSISLGFHLWIPVGEQTNHAGDPNVRGEPKVTMGGTVAHHFVWSFDGGVIIRQSQPVSPMFTTDAAGTELRLGAAVAWTDRKQRLQVGPELAFGTIVQHGDAFKSAYSTLELLLGAHGNIADLIDLGAAVGLGTLREVGTPDARAILRVAYAPRRKQRAATPVPVVAPVDSDGDGVPDLTDHCPFERGPADADPNKNGCPPVATPSDRDSDGVPDSADLCPDEPAGATPNPEKRGCPDKDADGDGVLDSKDVCPAVAAGAHPDSRRPGCPAEDADLDNVFDDVDACPETPGVPNADPKLNGCPLPDRDHDGVPDEQDACPDRAGVADPDAKRNGCPRIMVRRGDMTVLQPLFFATNEDTILPQSFPLLQTIASSLVAQPQIKRVSIEGHADDRGGSRFNQELSERRAASVLKFLVEHGVAPDRLESHGFGSSRPVSNKRDEESRARNRRVEFRILQRTPAP